MDLTRKQYISSSKYPYWKPRLQQPQFKARPIGNIIKGLLTSPDYRFKDFIATVNNDYSKNESRNDLNRPEGRSCQSIRSISYFFRRNRHSYRHKRSDGVCKYPLKSKYNLYCNSRQRSFAFRNGNERNNGLHTQNSKITDPTRR